MIKTFYRVKNKSRKRSTGRIMFAIRTDCYSESFDYFLTLVEEAKKDFPNLEPKDIMVREYGGISIRGIRGIEFSFNPPVKGSTKSVAIPNGYERTEIVHNIK